MTDDQLLKKKREFFNWELLQLAAWCKSTRLREYNPDTTIKNLHKKAKAIERGLGKIK